MKDIWYVLGEREKSMKYIYLKNVDNAEGELSASEENTSLT